MFSTKAASVAAASAAAVAASGAEAAAAAGAAAAAAVDRVLDEPCTPDALSSPRRSTSSLFSPSASACASPSPWSRRRRSESSLLLADCATPDRSGAPRPAFPPCNAPPSHLPPFPPPAARHFPRSASSCSAACPGCWDLSLASPRASPRYAAPRAGPREGSGVGHGEWGESADGGESLGAAEGWGERMAEQRGWLRRSETFAVGEGGRRGVGSRWRDVRAEQSGDNDWEIAQGDCRGGAERDWRRGWRAWTPLYSNGGRMEEGEEGEEGRGAERGGVVCSGSGSCSSVCDSGSGNGSAGSMSTSSSGSCGSGVCEMPAGTQGGGKKQEAKESSGVSDTGKSGHEVRAAAAAVAKKAGAWESAESGAERMRMRMRSSSSVRAEQLRLMGLEKTLSAGRMQRARSDVRAGYAAWARRLEDGSGITDGSAFRDGSGFRDVRTDARRGSCDAAYKGDDLGGGYGYYYRGAGGRGARSMTIRESEEIPAEPTSAHRPLLSIPPPSASAASPMRRSLSDLWPARPPLLPLNPALASPAKARGGRTGAGGWGAGKGGGEAEGVWGQRGNEGRGRWSLEGAHAEMGDIPRRARTDVGGMGRDAWDGGNTWGEGNAGAEGKARRWRRASLEVIQGAARGEWGEVYGGGMVGGETLAAEQEAGEDAGEGGMEIVRVESGSSSSSIGSLSAGGSGSGDESSGAEGVCEGQGRGAGGEVSGSNMRGSEEEEWARVRRQGGEAGRMGVFKARGVAVASPPRSGAFRICEEEEEEEVEETAYSNGSSIGDTDNTSRAIPVLAGAPDAMAGAHGAEGEGQRGDGERTGSSGDGGWAGEHGGNREQTRGAAWGMHVMHPARHGSAAAAAAAAAAPSALPAAPCVLLNLAPGMGDLLPRAGASYWHPLLPRAIDSIELSSKGCAAAGLESTQPCAAAAAAAQCMALCSALSSHLLAAAASSASTDPLWHL
ncbi:hypothetical protein CLOP_g21542, partial [Closterium sp. NIES-67]